MFLVSHLAFLVVESPFPMRFRAGSNLLYSGVTALEWYWFWEMVVGVTSKTVSFFFLLRYGECLIYPGININEIDLLFA